MLLEPCSTCRLPWVDRSLRRLQYIRERTWRSHQGSEMSGDRLHLGVPRSTVGASGEWNTGKFSFNSRQLRRLLTLPPMPQIPMQHLLRSLHGKYVETSHSLPSYHNQLYPVSPFWRSRLNPRRKWRRASGFKPR